MRNVRAREMIPYLAAALVLGLGAGCGKNDDSAACPAISGSPWVPQVTGASAANHDPAVQLVKNVVSASGTIVGVGESTLGRTITVTIPMDTDLGAGGSLTLDAEVTGFPATTLKGNAFPMLVYLSDGTNELTGLDPNCVSTGLFSCGSSGCTPSCSPGLSATASAYFGDKNHWMERQVSAFGYMSRNTFPTCNWATGTPGCAFNAGFFLGGKLRTGPGLVYTAKYVIVASDYLAVAGANLAAGLKVTAIRKVDPNLGGGAIDLNIVLVGSSNVRASRSPAGQANLNAVLAGVGSLLGQAPTGIKLGTIRALEWGCEAGGEAYANADISRLGGLFQSGSLKVDPTGEGKAINVFLVSSVGVEGNNHLVAGLSSSINGPALNGTEASGLAFASFDQLDTMSPTGVDFNNLSSTIAHEVGHYLGLNHPNEGHPKPATGLPDYDNLPDTPACTNIDPVRQVFTISSCAADSNAFAPTGKSCSTACAGYNGATVFCPLQPECAFNHLMWWTTKHFNEAAQTGDGNLISADSSAIINYNPYVQ